MSTGGGRPLREVGDRPDEFGRAASSNRTWTLGLGEYA
jgi:hypothetical protein